VFAIKRGSVGQLSLSSLDLQASLMLPIRPGYKPWLAQRYLAATSRSFELASNLRMLASLALI
jgi:hypothetical protein